MTKSSIKNAIGTVCMCLPFLIMISGFLYPGENIKNWWHSLSASYYNQNSFMFIICFSALIVLLFADKDVCSNLMGVFMAIILLFPCADGTLVITQDEVGVFGLSPSLSDKIHSLACLLSGVTVVIKNAMLIKQTKRKLFIVLLVLILTSIGIITYENILHSNGDWSFHWSTVFTETIIFVCCGVMYKSIEC